MDTKTTHEPGQCSLGAPRPKRALDLSRQVIGVVAAAALTVSMAPAAYAATTPPTAPPTAPAQTDAAPGFGQALYPSGVGADLGETPTTLGVAVRGEGAEAPTSGNEQGRSFWRTDPAAGSSWIGVDVADDYLHDVHDRSTVVVVTYLDTGTGALTLDTDGAAATQSVPLTDSKAWVQHAFVVDDGVYADGLDGDDLRIGGDTGVSVASVRVATALATAELGPKVVTSDIGVRGGDDPTGIQVGTDNGRGYWRTNAATPVPGAAFIYANVADDKLYDNSLDDVVVAADVLSDGSSLRLHYDSPGARIPDMFTASPVFAAGNTGEWTTASWVLGDAVMTNRSNGNDFRVAREGDTLDVSVSRLRVAKTAKTLDPRRGLSDIITTAQRAHDVGEEGTRDGEYPKGSRATLDAAIAAARDVNDDASASIADVEQAARVLYDAQVAFAKSKITTDIARGLTASASSNMEAAGAVVDGDSETVWEPHADDASPWIQIDLGETTTIDQITLDWQSGPGTIAVQTSDDGQTWATARTAGATSRTNTLNIPRTDARYVRVQVESSAVTVGLRSFEVRHLDATKAAPTLVKTANRTPSPVVADFLVDGADASGTSDSTEAIQAALNTCVDAGGGTVWLPVGRYLVTDTIKVTGFCTLRGDRKEPEKAAARGDYGTVIVADLPHGENGPSLFRVGGSAGVMGVTTWYPEQSIDNPVPYGFTFEIPGRAWANESNYMMSTISDVTMVNSWKGIGVSTFPNQQGLAPTGGNVHETATVRNVKGTVLHTGVSAFNGADVGTWENVTLDNGYWANAGSGFPAPERSSIDALTRSQGTGLELGDLEWDQFWRISVADYKYGVHIVPGQRVSFAGSFSQLTVKRTDTAMHVDNVDSRWGLAVSASTLEGSTASIVNESAGYVRVAGTTLTGPTSGAVHRLAAKPVTYDDPAQPHAPRAKLVDASAAPYSAPRGDRFPVDDDATPAIQRALNDTAKKGGGIVYLPAGWYTVAGALSVPKGVELRGAMAVPTRDQQNRSAGTVLRATGGRGSDTGAFVTLSGKDSGVTGIQIFHPDNNPNAARGGYVAYPTSIRIEGKGGYVVNVGMTNSWGGVDIASSAKGAIVRKVVGVYLNSGVRVHGAKNVHIEGVLNNGSAAYRIGFFEPEWGGDENAFPDTIDAFTRKRTTLIEADGAKDLKILNVFGYGLHHGIVAKDSSVTAVNVGADNLGEGGVGITASGRSDVSVANFLRYNGTSVSGPARVVGLVILQIVEHKLTTTVTPAKAGTVQVIGNETQPGSYEEGATVTVKAKPAKGKKFVGFRVDGVDAGSRELTLTIAADTQVEAVFR